MEKATYTYQIARNGDWQICENGQPMKNEPFYRYRNDAYARICELNGWKYDLPTEKQLKYLAFLAKDKFYLGSPILFYVNEYKASRKQVSKLIDELKNGQNYCGTMSELAER